jgi:hypothetical protein
MRLHNFSGKEQGAMLIGSAQELKELATSILSALEHKPDRSGSEWPPTLVSRDINETDAGKVSNFDFSVHLETTSASKPSPNLRSRVAFPILVGIAGIALWQIITWVRLLLA